MTMPEIIFGAILLVASLVIIVLTVSQRSKGQGMSALMGANNPMAGSNVRQEDVMLAKVTKVAGVVLVVVAVIACAVSARMG